MTCQNDENKPKARRGFAAMSAEMQRQIARKGGQSVPDEKRSFFRNRELASKAGSKGGRASHGGRGKDQGSEENRGTSHQGGRMESGDSALA